MSFAGDHKNGKHFFVGGGVSNSNGFISKGKRKAVASPYILGVKKKGSRRTTSSHQFNMFSGSNKIDKILKKGLKDYSLENSAGAFGNGVNLSKSKDFTNSASKNQNLEIIENI